MIACVAVVGKVNNPLFLKSFNSQTDEIKFHYIVHSAIDVVEERCREGKAPHSYLGLLYPTEDFKVYGYVTNTNIKLILVVGESEMKESDLKTFFERFHSIFVHTVCNPFYRLDKEITTKRFQLEITKLVAQTSS